MTRDEIRAALTDADAMLATLVGEALNEPVDSQLAVACSIRNRVWADLHGDGLPDWWGEGFKDVCLKRLQYSCWWETNSNSDRVYRVAEALVTPGGRTGLPVLLERRLRWVVDGVVSEAAPDTTKGSTHYLTRALYEKAPPPWARGRTPTVSVGAHHFFAGIER